MIGTSISQVDERYEDDERRNHKSGQRVVRRQRYESEVVLVRGSCGRDSSLLPVVRKRRRETRLDSTTLTKSYRRHLSIPSTHLQPPASTDVQSIPVMPSATRLAPSWPFFRLPTVIRRPLPPTVELGPSCRGLDQREPKEKTATPAAAAASGITKAFQPLSPSSQYLMTVTDSALPPSVPTADRRTSFSVPSPPKTRALLGHF